MGFRDPLYFLRVWDSLYIYIYIRSSFLPRVMYITLGIHVFKSYLRWALKSVNITYIGLFGSLG